MSRRKRLCEKSVGNVRQIGCGNDDEENGGETVLFELTGTESEPPRVSTRLRRRETRTKYTFKHNMDEFPNILDVGPAIDSLFATILEPSLRSANPIDVISADITSDNLNRG